LLETFIRSHQHCSVHCSCKYWERRVWSWTSWILNPHWTLQWFVNISVWISCIMEVFWTTSYMKLIQSFCFSVMLLIAVEQNLQMTCRQAWSVYALFEAAVLPMMQLMHKFFSDQLFDNIWFFSQCDLKFVVCYLI